MREERKVFPYFFCEGCCKFIRVNKIPLMIAVSGATVTIPKEPMIVCIISAATYL